MFKLESYITPLLLSYVDKYVKNLKPEDSQFSLWGGDAVFCNLDLRLEVLEQDLDLPFSFLNGHIHELRIHIPWTKLGSEPVVITINTIECILKLCENFEKFEADSQKSSKHDANKSTKHSEAMEAPSGYIQSLINRVISNICIICNNLVLKYVEDDIVLSLNIKSVELYNAGGNWERTYVDASLSDLVSRKVITMQDLTVCLDKRDACGKIETYQDPLLYRCSTTWRMYSLYDTAHSKYPVLTRIHMYCESLEFSLTDQQLPMFLRLLYLCVYLQNKSNFSVNEKIKDGDTNENAGLLIEDSDFIVDGKANEESWGSWALSFVPDVGLILGTSDAEELEKESNMLKLKKVFQFGIYIGKVSCVLKHTIPSSIKYTFSPFLILNLYGCSMEYTCKGKDFSNVQSGICGATISGVEECVCGYQDLNSLNNEEKNIFFKSGVPPGSGEQYCFLSSSLFDPLSPENCNKPRDYCFNFEKHLNTLTEEVMFQRYPAFSFDYVYELQVPEDCIDKMSNVTATFLEESNWHESSSCRLVLGPFCLDVTSSLMHRLSKLFYCAQDYEYPCYTMLRGLLTSNSNVNEEIIQRMEEFVPTRQYHLTLFKPVIHFFIASHSHHTPTHPDSRKVKKRNSKLLKNLRTPKNFESLFCLEMYAEFVDFKYHCPMYPVRLIKVIESCPKPSLLLFDHVYNIFSGKAFGLEVSLLKRNSNIISEPPVIQPTCISFFMRSLPMPETWTTNHSFLLKEFSLDCSKLHLTLSEIRFLALTGIYKSWTVKHFNPINLEKLQYMYDQLKNDLPSISIEVTNIKIAYSEKDDLLFMKLFIDEVFFKFSHQGQICTLFHAPESTLDVHNGLMLQAINESINQKEKCQDSFLQMVLQVPNKSSDLNSIFILCVSGSTACLEPALFSWLSSDFLSIVNSQIDFEVASLSSLDFDGMHEIFEKYLLYFYYQQFTNKSNFLCL